jgi:hypothetical protein
MILESLYTVGSVVFPEGGGVTISVPHAGVAMIRVLVIISIAMTSMLAA